jgi:uncharacterized protein (DUF488 family)
MLERETEYREQRHEDCDDMRTGGRSKPLASDGVQIYSIGHSDHSIEGFLDLLHRNGIALLVDVRSQPYSRWVPQFNREKLARELEAAGVHYIFMGDSLGGRPASPGSVNDDHGHSDYQQLAQSEPFKAGIEQLLELATAQRVSMMCAEGDYHRCHRSKLVTPALLEHGARVFHILPDGRVAEAQPEPRQLTLL